MLLFAGYLAVVVGILGMAVMFERPKITLGKAALEFVLSMVVASAGVIMLVIHYCLRWWGQP